MPSPVRDTYLPSIQPAPLCPTPSYIMVRQGLTVMLRSMHSACTLVTGVCSNRKALARLISAAPRALCRSSPHSATARLYYVLAYIVYTL
jgi:hypothetical protein